MSITDVAAPALGGVSALVVVLVCGVGLLARRYRRECRQLRERNLQLSAENDRWHEDFAAQAGELSALRRIVPNPSRYIDLSQAELQ